MDEKRKLKEKNRILKMKNLFKKQPLGEQKKWEKYMDYYADEGVLRHAHSKLKWNFDYLKVNEQNIKVFYEQNIKIFNARIDNLKREIKHLLSICDDRYDCIIDLLNRENYQVSTRNVFFHIQDCTFYTLSPFFKEDTNSNRITLVKTLTMQPVEFEFQKKDEIYRFYGKTLHNEREELPIYSFTELGLKEQKITTNNIYLMEKYYGKKLRRK